MRDPGCHTLLPSRDQTRQRQNPGQSGNTLAAPDHRIIPARDHRRATLLSSPREGGAASPRGAVDTFAGNQWETASVIARDCLRLPPTVLIPTARLSPNGTRESQLPGDFVSWRSPLLLDVQPMCHLSIYTTMNKSAQEMVKCLEKFVPPDQKPGIIHADNSLDFASSGRICVGITTSEHHTDQKPTELPRTRSVEKIMVPLHFTFSQLFLKNGGMECFCYLRNVQDKLANGKSQYQSPLIHFWRRCL